MDAIIDQLGVVCYDAPPFSPFLISSAHWSNSEEDNELESGDNSILPLFSPHVFAYTSQYESEGGNELNISVSDSVNSLSLLDCTPLIINDINTPDITVNDGSDHDKDLGNMSLEVASVELKNAPDNCLRNGMKELGTTSENVGTGEVNDPHDPHLINDISSPYVSTPTVLSWKPADTGKSDKGNLSFFRNTLQNAGYTPSEVDDAILAYIDKQKTCNHAAYDKNRPQTHIFSHGKVHTPNSSKAKPLALLPAVENSLDQGVGP